MAIGIGSEPTGDRILGQTRHALFGQLRRLASGDRIGRAAADAAGLALSERLRADLAGQTQGVRNLNDGIAALRVAEGALDESASLLGRLRELHTRAANGTLGSGERRVLQREADQLTAEISRVAHVTRFDGRSLLDGSQAGGIELADGTGQDGLAISPGDQSAAALGIDSLDISDPASLAAIDAAVSSLSSARAELGAREQQISSSVRSLSVAVENTTAAESRIRDTDYAAATSALARDQILEHSGLAVKVQANMQVGAALRVLEGV